MGRPKKSATALEQSGAFDKNPNRRRFNPSCVSGVIEKPEIVSSDEIASDCWDRVVDSLQKLKVVSQTDWATVESFCCAYSAWQQAVVRYRVEGPVVETEKGPKRNPIAVEMLAQQTVVNKLASELGLSPSGRARLTVDPTSDDDVFTEWLKMGTSN